MTRVLVGGLCPLPFENTRKSFGPGIRSWQFALSLAQDGHAVRLLAMKIPGCYDGFDVTNEEEVEGVHVVRLSEGAFHDVQGLRDQIRTFRPDVLVGATIYGSHALARCETDQPFWADQFGHVMAEAQAKAALDGQNDVLPYFWKMARKVDLRADRLSSVSERQRLAMIGELGALGRLSAETCGYEFGAVIPCAVLPPSPPASLPNLRGSRLPADAFVVLWSGSYNVWSDVETLYGGLEIAMREDPTLYFVSTGGAIPGHDEMTYRRLRELVEGSDLRSRFLLEGWIAAEAVAGYWAEADLGVLTERPIYEGTLGSKNRIVQWLGSGLPVAYNRVGDIGDLLDRAGIGLTFDAGDATGLAEKILWASRHRSELEAMAERARDYSDAHLSFSATTVELRRWVAHPTRAPDRRTIARGIESPMGFATQARSAVASLGKIPLIRRSNHLRKLWRSFRSILRRRS